MAIMSLLRGTLPKVSLSALLGRQGQGNSKMSVMMRNFTTSGKKDTIKAMADPLSPHSVKVVPSRYQWHVYKDLFHFYLFLGVIPLSAIVFFANVFVGPATLTEIPEGYVPEHWEYHKNPVTRFLVRYMYPNWQEQYERNCHYMNVIDEKRRMRLLKWRVEALMRERGDYPNYYTNKTTSSKYVRGSKLEREYVHSTRGEF